MDIWEMRGYVLDCGKYTDDDFENDDFLFTLMTGGSRILWKS